MSKRTDEEVDKFVRDIFDVVFWLHMNKSTINEKEYSDKTSLLMRIIKDFKKEKE